MRGKQKKGADSWREDEDMLEIIWTGKQRREGGANVIVWVQKATPRPPFQSDFVVKSLAGGLSPTWLSENNRLLL